jgi:DNA invertase Pin-like site-specific DNA recombinase
MVPCTNDRVNWPQYAKALDLRFGGSSYSDIATVLGISKQRVQQLVSVAKQQLAHRVFATPAPLLNRGHRQLKHRRKKPLKLDALRIALADAGFVSIRAQAKALGLSHSTTWHLFNGDPKFGITKLTLRRILASPHIPQDTRQLLLSFSIAR